MLVLDDGTEITRRVTPSTSDTKVKQNGKTVTRAAEAIRKLTDLLSVNPVEFLTAAKKDRVQILLESMPVTVDTVYLSEISGLAVDPELADLRIDKSGLQLRCQADAVVDVALPLAIAAFDGVLATRAALARVAFVRPVAADLGEMALLLLHLPHQRRPRLAVPALAHEIRVRRIGNGRQDGRDGEHHQHLDQREPATL